jgi:pyrroloquinoline quinone biosynthesis protein E
MRIMADAGARPTCWREIAEADPVCAKSAHHGRVEHAVRLARRATPRDEQPLVFRSVANSIARSRG